MKFGGTSVGNASSMKAVSGIVQNQMAESGAPPMVVLSACSGVTNSLAELVDESASNRLRRSIQILSSIREHHETLLDELIKEGDAKERLFQKLKRVEKEVSRFLRAIHVIGECPDRLVAEIMSIGERLSTTIFTEKLREEGVKVEWIDAKKLITTNENFLEATPLWDMTKHHIETKVKPMLEEGSVVVTQGFVGSTSSGKTTVLGRGGSDYSASIFGAALKVEAIQIWTDVDGVLTADPRIVPGARRLKQLSFNEAAEFAYFGAKVLHPLTLRPAMKENIPVYVLNSKRPKNEGTQIVREIESNNGLVKAIAVKKGQIIVSITTSRMLGAVGFILQVTKLFAEHKVAIDMISTSEISLSLTTTVPKGKVVDELVKELSKIGTVQVQEHVAMICVIGDSLHQAKGVASRIFRTVADQGTNVIMISQGASEINVGFVVSESEADDTVRALHHAFLSSVAETKIFA